MHELNHKTSDKSYSITKGKNVSILNNRRAIETVNASGPDNEGLEMFADNLMHPFTFRYPVCSKY